ncbi:hypothetical protein Syun_016884 [Stephania yunnanensis]|uniref:Senescence regulator n=1 Tax=Stephania yunnanensis TaxID=152371 RepID=A0AAP0J888_9MAGN
MAKPSYQYHQHHHHHHHRHNRSYNSVTNPEAIFEFDEADLWNSNNSSHSSHHQMESSSQQEWKKSVKKRSNRVSIKQRSFQIESHEESVRGAATSLPVNIPDWSRILRRDGGDRRRENEDLDDEFDDDDGGGVGSMIPPHEFLARQFARTGIASFSVHEGIGRTLKGRDLSRVRDVILKKTGFED